MNHSRKSRMLKLFCRSHVPEKNCRVDFEPEVLEEEIEWLEFSEENSKNQEDRKIQRSYKVDKEG